MAHGHIFVIVGFGFLGSHVVEMHKVIALVLAVYGYHVVDQARQNVVLETPGQPIQMLEITQNILVVENASLLSSQVKVLKMGIRMIPGYSNR